MRRILLLLALAGAALATATPAYAGTAAIQNSCRYSLDNVWRHLTIDWTGTGSPNPVAPGSGVTLTQTTAHTRLPDYLAQAGHQLGILKAGENEIRAHVWLALQGDTTTQGIQVRDVETVARTTITEDANGNFVSSTPIDVTVPIPDTAWTAGGASVTFRQGSKGALPAIPAGVGGAMVTPLGSVFIRATIGSLAMNLDCQPGVGEGTATPASSVADGFETVGVQDGAASVKPPKAKPKIAVSAASLKGSRVKLTIACSAAPCEGTVRAGTRKFRYTLESGSRTTVKLTLRAKPKQVTLRVSLAGGKAYSKVLKPRKAAAKASVAAAKRVVAIEWDTVENLHMLGMAPVGAADMKGYDTWVAAPRPRGMKDIGSRQSPSLERIAALKPDLIVVPDYRSTKNLAQLKKIATVLVTHPYPSSGSQLNAMVTDFRRLASAVGRSARGEQVLQQLSNTLARSKAAIKRAGKAGASVAIATPGGTSSAPAIRMFTPNSQTADVVRRLGLRDGWSGTARYGFSTVGLEALSRVNGWLAFVYPPQFSRQVSNLTKTSAYKKLPVVKSRRVRTLAGTTWLFGGPRSTMLFAERLAAALK
jgi:iron complex transport system substrate-binding protein